ncbi:hypothetical protein JCM11491_000881 [Sporobolomyces phaffii]
MAATERLAPLLNPPSVLDARASARELVASSTSACSSPRQLGTVLKALATQEQSRLVHLEAQLATSTQIRDDLVQRARDRLKAVRHRAKSLRDGHDQLRTDASDVTDSLVSSDRATLRAELVALAHRKRSLERARKWFATVAQAEHRGLAVLEALDANLLPQAFRAYVALVDYIKLVYADLASTPARDPDDNANADANGNGGNGMVGLTGHLVGIANSVWNSLVKVLSTRLLSKLEALGWPTPFPEPLDPFEDSKVAEFQTAFVDLLTLELLQNNTALPSALASAGAKPNPKPKPLLALVPLVHPLLLRFKWQFDGDRSTNRIDKPEYPLAHVLNLLTAHERFLTEDVQYLLSTNGFDHLDALDEFTTLLVTPLAQRVRHHAPQLVHLPPVLAHTIYQVVEFDQVLRARGYPGPRKSGTAEADVVAAAAAAAEERGEWEGLSQVILGRREWFEKWLEGEREFFDKRYYAAIGAPEAWQIVPAEDYDASLSPSGTRPTASALRVNELAEQLADRYRPLPLRYTVPFLVRLHLALVGAYAKRVTSSLDAFESLGGFGSLLPGALLGVGSGTGPASAAATQGVGGVVRLARAGVSARWMSERCQEWGEDAFFLHLYEYLAHCVAAAADDDDEGPTIDDPDDLALADEVVENSDGTVFDRERTTFRELADRSEDLIVRHCTREVVAELKPYFAKRFDLEDQEEEEDDAELSLSPELVPALALLSSLLAALVAAYPATTLASLYRRIAASVSRVLVDRVVVAHAWTERSARTRLRYDFEHGFVAAGKDAGVPLRGIERGWELAKASIKVVALPAAAAAAAADDEGSRYDPGRQWTFSKVMQVVWDDDDATGAYERMMEDLGVGDDVLTRREVKTLLRQRPECWR